MIASATPAGYKAALTAFLADPNIDTVVPIFVPPFGVRQEDLAEAIVSAAVTRPASRCGRADGAQGGAAKAARVAPGGDPRLHLPRGAARALNAPNRQREWGVEHRSEARRRGEVDRQGRGDHRRRAREGRAHLSEGESIALAAL
ncbi:MAG: hypothetical protein IPN47_16130 [Gemmatimonadetes bacterium]|nr:hypothetical protein [Gemmatimonadota bacterium]